ncbi:MAG: hypothetical protein AAAB35_23025 [Phyllobacterium sp.]|uniref:hypothetical protein n=1 Tax=Phyllobacterium sp. TaxID=1871046 RepID=UPI0030F1C04F
MKFTVYALIPNIEIDVPGVPMFARHELNLRKKPPLGFNTTTASGVLPIGTGMVLDWTSYNRARRRSPQSGLSLGSLLIFCHPAPHCMISDVPMASQNKKLAAKPKRNIFRTARESQPARLK